MLYNSDIIKLGEKLRGQYLYNVYNEADILKFMLTKHNDRKNINNKIIKLLT